MTTIDKSKYKIIEDGGKDFILVSQVHDYAIEYFKSKFRIPAYRTIRYYITKNVFERPQKLGKETYLELDYIIGAIKVMRVLSVWSLTIKQLQDVIANARSMGKFDEVFNLVSDALGRLRNSEAREVFIKQLSMKKPSEIDLANIIKKYPEPESGD